MNVFVSCLLLKGWRWFGVVSVFSWLMLWTFGLAVSVETGYENRIFFSRNCVKFLKVKIWRCINLLKIKNKTCLNGDKLFFVAFFTDVLNRIFSNTSFGCFAVKNSAKLNYCSTLVTANRLTCSSNSPIFSSVSMLNKNHEFVPTII